MNSTGKIQNKHLYVERTKCKVLSIRVLIMLSFLIFKNGYSLTEKEIIGLWETSIGKDVYIGMELMSSHDAHFLMIRSVLSPKWQLQGDTIVLSFPDEHKVSTNRQIMLKKDINGMQFLRSGLLVNMPKEMEEIHIVYADKKRWFSTMVDAHGREYYDLKNKTLPPTLQEHYIEILARLWQHDKESLATVVKLPQTSPETLLWVNAIISKGNWSLGDQKLAIAIGGHPHTPINIIEESWNKWSLPACWRAIAYNPATNNKFLDAYTNRILSGSSHVRFDAAEDQETPVSLMEELARDKSENVARQIAFHKKLPPSVLAILAEHPNEYVRCVVAKHSDLTPSIQAKIAHTDTPLILRILLQNPKLDDKARQEALNRLCVAEPDGFSYTTNSDATITIAEYRGCGYIMNTPKATNNLAVNIPTKINGWPVTSIGKNAFNMRSVVSVIIPDSVLNIGEGAFNSCGYLTNITIGNSVTNIGNLAFSQCRLNNIIIPKNVTHIGWGALTQNPLSNITVDTQNSAFSSLNGVLFSKDHSHLILYPLNNTTTNYSIPEGVQSIEHGAFAGASRLIYITIPKSVTNIATQAFVSCDNLQGLYFKGNAPTIDESMDMFYNNKKAVVYFSFGTKGWDLTFGGRPTKLFIPKTISLFLLLAFLSLIVTTGLIWRRFRKNTQSPAQSQGVCP